MPRPDPSPDFRALQAQLGAHLRDPERVAAPDAVDTRGLAIYRDLVYRNVERAVASGFPVIRQLSNDEAWHARVRDFLARHACAAPQFNRIAEEFVAFLADERGVHPDDPPYLAELAHYEWVELALGLRDEDAPAPRTPSGDVLDAPLRVSPLAWTLSYAWPVHRLGPSYTPAAPPEVPTYLVVWRDPADDVRFMEINAVTARLMQLASEQPAATGQALLAQIAQDIGRPPATIESDGRAMIERLLERGCLFVA
jgi:hypothetical protein